jgi:hypothetical protein
MDVYRPTNLYEVMQACIDLNVTAMNDRRMALQVKEATNALGKALAAGKTHLEACRISGLKPENAWKQFMHESPNPTPPPRKKVAAK